MAAYKTDWIQRLQRLRETDPSAVEQINARADEIYNEIMAAETAGYETPTAVEAEADPGKFAYSRGGVDKTPGARWLDSGREPRARAHEQALKEYERTIGTMAVADLPEEDPLTGLPEYTPELDPDPSLETEIVAEDERDEYPRAEDTTIVPFKSAEELAQMSQAERIQYRKDRLRSVGAGDRLRDTATGLTDEELAGQIEAQEEGWADKYKDIYRQRPAPKRPTTPIAEAVDQDTPDDLEPLPWDDMKDLENPTLLQRLGRFAGSDKGLSVLSALAKGGQAYMGGRAQSEANRRSGQSQARANLINALSSRAGARGVTEKPTMGKLGTLFGTLADIGGGLRDERTLERERDLKERKLAGDEAARQATEDYRSTALKGQQAERAATAAYRAEKLTIDEAAAEYNREAKEFQRQRLEEERTYRRGKDKQAEMQREATNLSKLADSAAYAGAFDTFDEFVQADPSVRSVYENLDPDNQMFVQGQFANAQNRAKKDGLSNARITAAQEARNVAELAEEWGYRGEAASLDEALAANSELKQLYDSLDTSGRALIMAKFKGGEAKREKELGASAKKLTFRELATSAEIMKTSFDAIEDPSSYWASKFVEGDIEDKPSYITKRLFEEESTYRALRDALSLQLASAFNRGRPSDKDYVVAKELLPVIGDTKGISDAKWEALAYLISMKQQAETAGWRAEENQEFLARIVNFDRGRPSVDFSEAQQFFRGFVPVTDQTGTADPRQGTSTLRNDKSLLE